MRWSNNSSNNYLLQTAVSLAVLSVWRKMKKQTASEQKAEGLPLGLAA